MSIEEVCKYCKKNPINKLRSKVMCTSCLDLNKTRSKRNQTRIRARRKRNGLCVHCGKNPIAPKSKSTCEVCLEKRNGWQKGYESRTPEKALASKYGAVAKNPKKYRAIKEKYRQKNKCKWTWYAQNRRAKMLGIGGKIKEEDWMMVLSIYGSNCLCCGSSENIERDHVVAVSKGGDNTPNNLQPLCRTCNRRKNNKTIDYRPFPFQFPSPQLRNFV